MQTLKIDRLIFKFKEDCKATQLDEWSFYRKQFIKLGSEIRLTCYKCSSELRCKECSTRKNIGIKACDIVALQNSTAWIIEVKDYRKHCRLKAIDLADEVALKVRDSLALILSAKMRASDPEESNFAKQFTECSDIRILLHLEQPKFKSRLFPQAIIPSAVQQRMRQLVRAIDPHPKVVDINSGIDVPWAVTDC